MSTGILGSTALGATTNTTVYTVPTSTIASCTIRICNLTTDEITLRLAVASAATPATSEYIEYGTLIGANEILETTGIVLGAGKKVVAYADKVGLSVNIWGYEENV